MKKLLFILLFACTFVAMIGQNRKPLSLTKPIYEAEEEGKVEYEFVINPAGEVLTVRVLSSTGSANLEKSGKEAIKQWKFAPSQKAENEIAKVTLTFKLKPKC